jgi:ankyrin repeat protein
MDTMNTRDIFIHSIMNQDLQKIRELYDAGKNNMSGWTPLHYAAHHGKLTSFECLLELGEDLNALSYSASSALSYAARSPFDVDYGIISKLITNPNAPINSKDENGFTPLLDACFNRNLNSMMIIELLIRYGADINMRCVHHKTVLHFAALCCVCTTKKIKMLCRFGATPLLDVQNSGERTVFHMNQHNAEVARTFLLLGADPTPYSHICQARSEGMISWTEDEAADLRYEVYFSWSLLDQLLSVGLRDM